MQTKPRELKGLLSVTGLLSVLAMVLAVAMNGAAVAAPQNLLPPTTDEIEQPYLPEGVSMPKFDVKLDDGAQHSTELPADQQQGIQFHGKDILFTTNDGRTVNVSWTVIEARKKLDAYLATLPDDKKKAMQQAFYSSYTWNPNLDTIAFDMKRWVFRQDGSTGELSFVDTTQSGFQPGDVFYENRLFLLDPKSPRWTYNALELAPYAYSWGPQKNDAGQWGEPRNNAEVLAPEDYHLDGQYLTSYYDGSPDTCTTNIKQTARCSVIWNGKTDQDVTERLAQWRITIPEGEVITGRLTAGFGTPGWGSVAVYSARTTLYRLPEIRVHDVLESDYRTAVGYEADEPIQERVSKTFPGVVDPNASPGDGQTKATAAQLRDSLYSPIDIRDLAEPTITKDRAGSQTYWLDSDYKTTLRINDFVGPIYNTRPEKDEWDSYVNQPLEGYVLTGTDIPDRRIDYAYAIDPDNKSVYMRKEYYRLYRAIPGAVEIHKSGVADSSAGDDSAQPLPGAKFELWNADHSTKISDETFTTDADGKIAFYSGDKALTDLLSDDSVKELPAADENGIIHVDAGILFEPGKYALKEIEAPEGYELPAEPFTDFEVQARTEANRYAAQVVDVHNSKVPVPPVTTTTSTTSETTTTPSSTEPTEPTEPTGSTTTTTTEPTEPTGSTTTTTTTEPTEPTGSTTQVTPPGPPTTDEPGGGVTPVVPGTTEPETPGEGGNTPTTEPEVPEEPTEESKTTGPLAVTGANVIGLAIAALLAIVVGFFLARRKNGHQGYQEYKD